MKKFYPRSVVTPAAICLLELRASSASSLLLIGWLHGLLSLKVLIESVCVFSPLPNSVSSSDIGLSHLIQPE